MIDSGGCTYFIAVQRKQAGTVIKPNPEDKTKKLIEFLLHLLEKEKITTIFCIIFNNSRMDFIIFNCYNVKINKKRKVFFKIL